MNSREVICRVKALYPYESNDPSSLSFKVGAIIEVFSQLDSGWWDGWSNGKRGWFPSNYVEVLSEDPNTPTWKREYREKVKDHTMQNQLRLSLHASDMLIEQPRQQSAWILQTTEDGSEQYYYNLQTQEMRYSMPSDYHPEDIATNGNKEIHSNQSNGSLRDTFQQQQDSRAPVRPVRAANRGITDSFYGGDFRSRARNNTDYSYSPTRSGSAVPSSQSTLIKSPVESEFEDDVKLPPNWVKKTTPKGRDYYCNVKTEETTWELKNIDLATGSLNILSPNSVSPVRPVHSPHEDSIFPQEPPEIEDDIGPITWHNLSTVIAQAIIQLKEAARQGKQPKFIHEVTMIVRRIRILLYASNCLEKETSPHLKGNKQLRALHRGLLAAVAKLVLSAKVASSVWRSPESLIKLVSDADECLVNIRHFMSLCQELQIEIKDKKPVLTITDDPQPMTARNNIKGVSLILGQPETLDAIDMLVGKVRGALETYRSNIMDVLRSDNSETIQENVPLFVAQFRNLSNTVSQLLNVVQDICRTQPKDPRTVLLLQAKTPISVSMGALFIVSQTIASPDQQETSERIEEYVRTIEFGIQQVIEAVQKKEVVIDDYYFNDPTEELASPNTISSTYIGDVMTEDHMSEDVYSNQMKKQEAAEPVEDESTKRIVVGSSSSTSAVSVSIVSTPSTDNTSVWFLGPDSNDGKSEMIYTAEGNVKGGTLHGLVQHLTQHDQLDSKFNTTFLLTYRSFCTTEELFSELFNRYQLTPPEGLKPEEVEMWKEKKLKLVRLRVFNVIKSWLETYYNEEEDRHMLPEITRFTDTVIVETMKFGADQLSKLVKKRMLAEDSSQIRKMKLNVRTAEMPVPILPKSMKRLKLLELDPQELARQLTIMDFRLYNRIKPVECLDKNWGKPDGQQGHHIAANIKASIEHSNQITAWVTDSILSKEETKRRASVLKHWILVAERCRSLNNFNTCMAILSAFDNGSIGRLKRTWELISTRAMAILQNIRRLMGANRNFSEYREIIHKVNPPCIPFLGIYLQDLTFIEDGNSNFLKKSNHLINFSKRMKTAEVIRDLQQYQSTHYMLQAVPDIQEFIQTHLHSSREEEELYNISLRLEPRERGEDTIARRLKESGL